MPTLLEAIQKHKAVLDENLELWKLVGANHGSDEGIKLAIARGYQDTLAMIEAWVELKATFSTPSKIKSTKQKAKRQSTDLDVLPVPESKRRRVDGEDANVQGSAATSETTPVVDASGLFMIDPNPSNVSTLLSQNQGNNTGTEPRKKKKRKHSEPQDDEELQSQPAVVDQKPRRKRRRAGSTFNPLEQAELESESKSAPNGAVDNDDTHHQAFEAKVALRLKEKEERRKKTPQKKRKRSSEASTVADKGDQLVNGGNAAVTSETLRKPRAKKAKSNTAAGTEVDSSSKKKPQRSGSNTAD